jgi:hypothetical protein
MSGHWCCVSVRPCGCICYFVQFAGDLIKIIKHSAKRCTSSPNIKHAMKFNARQFITFLLASTLLFQAYDTARAAQSDCCPDSCQNDNPYCLMLGNTGICKPCSIFAINAALPHLPHRALPTYFNKTAHSNEIISISHNNIWRPPILDQLST